MFSLSLWNSPSSKPKVKINPAKYLPCPVFSDPKSAKDVSKLPSAAANNVPPKPIVKIRPFNYDPGESAKDVVLKPPPSAAKEVTSDVPPKEKVQFRRRLAKDHPFADALKKRPKRNIRIAPGKYVPRPVFSDGESAKDVVSKSPSSPSPSTTNTNPSRKIRKSDNVSSNRPSKFSLQEQPDDHTSCPDTTNEKTDTLQGGLWFDHFKLLASSPTIKTTPSSSKTMSRERKIRPEPMVSADNVCPRSPSPQEMKGHKRSSDISIQGAKRIKKTPEQSSKEDDAVEIHIDNETFQELSKNVKVEDDNNYSSLEEKGEKNSQSSKIHRRYHHHHHYHRATQVTYHSNRIAVLAVTQNGWTLCGFNKSISVDDSIDYRTLKHVKAMGLKKLYFADAFSQHEWIVLKKREGWHYKYLLEQILPSSEFMYNNQTCKKCFHVDCHRWLASACGMSQLLGVNIYPLIKH